MGEFQAGKTLIALSIYFMILIFSLFLIESYAVENNLEYSVTSNGNETNLLQYSNIFGVCENPRYYIESDTKEIKEISIFSEFDPNCKYSAGNYDETSCNAIDGCSWQNTTSFWWFENTDVQECTGDVNVSSLGLAGVEVTVYGDIDLLIEINDVVDNDQRELACGTLGFTWNDDTDQSSVKLASITQITGSLFSYQASFTDDFLLDLLLTTILFYLPFIILLIALYFALPFLH